MSSAPSGLLVWEMDWWHLCDVIAPDLAAGAIVIKATRGCSGAAFDAASASRHWPRARADITFLGVFWTAPTRRGACFDAWTARVALLARVSRGAFVASVRRRLL